jgi:hypothetical protein
LAKITNASWYRNENFTGIMVLDANDGGFVGIAIGGSNSCVFFKFYNLSLLLVGKLTFEVCNVELTTETKGFPPLLSSNFSKFTLI